MNTKQVPFFSFWTIVSVKFDFDQHKKWQMVEKW